MTCVNIIITAAFSALITNAAAFAFVYHHRVSVSRSESVFGGTSTIRHALSDTIHFADESHRSFLLSASSHALSTANPLKSSGIAHWLATSILTTFPSSDIDTNTANYFFDKQQSKPFATTSSSISVSSSSSSSMATSSSSSSTQSSYRPLTQSEISLLQKAFASYYVRSPNKNIDSAEQSKELLGECISIWTRTSQSGDEIAALYRVRGDVNMELGLPREAEADYTSSIHYLEGEDGYKADAEELPISHLGRARAIRSQMMMMTVVQKMSTKDDDVTMAQKIMQASKDYEVYLTATSRVDDDYDDAGVIKDEVGVASNSDDSTMLVSSVIRDGILHNPYAAWEWGMINRSLHLYNEAAEIHRLAALAFGEIGDKARSVICSLDRGIDLASGLAEDRSNTVGKEANNNDGGRKKLLMVKRTLEDAISSDVDVGGRDVELLQRLVAKEGEARVVLAGVLWSLDDRNDGSKATAESEFGTACTRLDELNADYRARMGKRLESNNVKSAKLTGGGAVAYSIDDIVGADEASCSRFKNDKFIEEKLVWNDGLKMLVKKFISLSR